MTNSVILQDMNFLKWQIGDVEILQLVELDNVGAAIQEAIPQATPENIKKNHG